MDDRIPLQRIATGAEMRRARNEDRYTLAQTVSLLGILALVLAAAGLYGVVSYMVTMRQKEIGIRMALGAAGGSVLRLIVRQSIVPVLAGCVLGAVGAVAVGALIRSRLYGVSPVDPRLGGDAGKRHGAGNRAGTIGRISCGRRRRRGGLRGRRG
jgi:predicted lysophospholipase L1 biosynthesis ABC-type transport system permease subunit